MLVMFSIKVKGGEKSLIYNTNREINHYKIIKIPLNRNEKYVSFCVAILSNILFTLLVQQKVQQSHLT